MIVTASVSVTAMPDAGQVSYTDIDCFPATVSVDCNNVQLVPLRLSATLRSGTDNNPVDVFWRAHIQSVGSDLGTVDSPGASAQWEYSLPSDKWGKADSIVVEAYTDSSRLDMIAQKRVGIIRQNPSPFPVEGDWRPLPFKYKNGEYFLDKTTNFIFLWMNPVPGNSESHPFVDVSQNPDTTSWDAHQEYPLLGTQLLLARKIDADLIDVDNLRVKHLDGAEGSLNSGTIGGFELADGRIGTVYSANSSYGLSITDTNLHVGNSSAMVFIGPGSSNSVAGTTSAARIVSNREGRGTLIQFAYNDGSIYSAGLRIKPNGGSERKYGLVLSELPSLGGAFIGTRLSIQELHSVGQHIDINLSKHSIFLISSYIGDKSIELPSESLVCEQFGLPLGFGRSLPNDFAVEFTIKCTGPALIRIMGVYNANERLIGEGYPMRAGDTLRLLLMKQGGFRYHCLYYNTVQ